MHTLNHKLQLDTYNILFGICIPCKGAGKIQIIKEGNIHNSQELTTHLRRHIRSYKYIYSEWISTEESNYYLLSVRLSECQSAAKQNSASVLEFTR